MSPLDNYAKQNQNKIMMAKPEELTTMLYDGAIKFCNIAIMSIEKNDIQKAHTNIIKAQNIISYLENTLNLEYEVSKDFLNIYSYIEYHLIQANIKKDINELEECLKQLKTIKNTWLEVCKIIKNT